MKIRVIVKRPYGDVEVEGESLDEVVEGLETFPDWLVVIDKLVTGLETADKGPLFGLVEFSSEGPLITVPKERVSDRESIGLLLYAKDPEALEPKELGRLLNLSGRPSAGFGSRLSEMRREGHAVKEGNAYRLSVAGKRWIEEVVSRLRA